MDTHAGAFAWPRRIVSALGWDVACRRRVHYSKSELIRRFGGETPARKSPAGGFNLRLGCRPRISNSLGGTSAINAGVRSRTAYERRRSSPAAGGVSRRFSAARIWALCSHRGHRGSDGRRIPASKTAGSVACKGPGPGDCRSCRRATCRGRGTAQKQQPKTG